MGDTSRTYYYARVSSRDQNLARQINAFRKLGADERDIIMDKQSGKDLDRIGYNSLKNVILRPGDTLVVMSLDRLSRSKADIKNEMEWFKANNIRLKILDIPTSMIEPPAGQEWVFDMVNNILIEVLGSFAETERETIRKRQRQGIDAALEKGVHFGRKTVLPENFDEVTTRWRNGELTAVAAMKELGMKKSTFYKFVKEQDR